MAVKFTDDNFKNEVLDSDQPVLVDFFAQWCVPCKMLGPSIELLADKFAGKVKIGKLDVDENMASAQTYKIMSVPTLIIFKNGEVLERLEQGIDAAGIEAKLAAL